MYRKMGDLLNKKAELNIGFWFVLGYRDWLFLNPLTPAAVSKPLEVIGSPTYVLACQEPTAPDSDINQTAGSLGRPSMWKNWCMHAAVCAACRQAQTRRRRGEIGGIPRWILLGRIRPNGRKRVNTRMMSIDSVLPYLYFLALYSLDGAEVRLK